MHATRCPLRTPFTLARGVPDNEQLILEYSQQDSYHSVVLLRSEAEAPRSAGTPVAHSRLGLFQDASGSSSSLSAAVALPEGHNPASDPIFFAGKLAIKPGIIFSLHPSESQQVIATTIDNSWNLLNIIDTNELSQPAFSFSIPRAASHLAITDCLAFVAGAPPLSSGSSQSPTQSVSVISRHISMCQFDYPNARSPPTAGDATESLIQRFLLAPSERLLALIPAPGLPMNALAASGLPPPGRPPSRLPATASHLTRLMNYPGFVRSHDVLLPLEAFSGNASPAGAPATGHPGTPPFDVLAIDDPAETERLARELSGCYVITSKCVYWIRPFTISPTLLFTRHLIPAAAPLKSMVLEELSPGPGDEVDFFEHAFPVIESVGQTLKLNLLHLNSQAADV
ncbi:hypothetical protein H696_06342, partial [Fonticula alba]